MVGGKINLSLIGVTTLDKSGINNHIEASVLTGAVKQTLY
jgi:hypothetical protein